MVPAGLIFACGTARIFVDEVSMKLKGDVLAPKHVAPEQVPTSHCTRVSYGTRIQSSRKYCWPWIGHIYCCWEKSEMLESQIQSP